MRTKQLVFAAAVAITCGALQGQNVVYQQAGAIGGAIGTVSVSGGPVNAGFGIVSSATMGGRAVTGNPFSATEQRHSLQILGDGTHIEQTDNSQISRDAEGRTRTESTPGGAGAPAIVTIQDPVAGATWFLDPAHKTATKLPAPRVLTGASIPASMAVSGGVSSSRISMSPADAAQTGAIKEKLATFSEGNRAATQILDDGSLRPLVTLQSGPAFYKAMAAPEDEDLGVQNVNGVLAKGTRTTINIPAGQIGNDRALNVVNERWYSDDLGMIVKSSNSDPRFGTTTYELTTISRGAPDPSLFQVPADYTVNEEKAMFKTVQPR